MSTVPFCRNGSRFFEIVSVHLILLGSMPSLAATILAISMSKPSGASLPGFLNPMPGWSNFTPTLIEPASCSLAIVVPAANLASFSTGVAASSPPPPQAAAASASTPASATALIPRVLIRASLVVIRFPPSRLVAEDLGQEVLGPVTASVGEELLGTRLLDDAAAVHEDHSVGRAAGEAHLVRDHDHGHALFGQGGHDVEHLVDHL